MAEAAAQMDAVVIDVGDAEVEGLSDASEGELVDRAEGEGEGDISDGRAFDAGAGVQIAFNPPGTLTNPASHLQAPSPVSPFLSFLRYHTQSVLTATSSPRSGTLR